MLDFQIEYALGLFVFLQLYSLSLFIFIREGIDLALHVFLWRYMLFVFCQRHIIQAFMVLLQNNQFLLTSIKILTVYVKIHFCVEVIIYFQLLVSLQL